MGSRPQIQGERHPIPPKEGVECGAAAWSAGNFGRIWETRNMF
jgi:hypothetical protein